MVVSEVERYSELSVVYRGEDTVDKFLECLETGTAVHSAETSYYWAFLDHNEEEQMFQDTANFHIFWFELRADRVRDHCLVTGTYRGTAHNDSNLNYKFTGKCTVVLHNLRCYTSAIWSCKNSESSRTKQLTVSWTIQKSTYNFPLIISILSILRNSWTPQWTSWFQIFPRMAAISFQISRNTSRMARYRYYRENVSTIMTTWIVWRELTRGGSRNFL